MILIQVRTLIFPKQFNGVWFSTPQKTNFIPFLLLEMFTVDLSCDSEDFSYYIFRA